MNCYCSSLKLYRNCCESYILGKEKAPTAEALMRSRYSAYCVEAVDYLLATTHSSTRKSHNKEETLHFAQKNKWLKLEIINASEETIVEFKAYYLDSNLQTKIHHEKSTFKMEQGSWYYVDGVWF